MKNIILSFDYELFFGDVPGTVQKTLIEPTNHLLDAMDEIGAKGSFFVDYLMLKYMTAENDETRAEAQIIITQLQDIVKRGHRIELHLHPHWVDAKWLNGKWDFTDYTHYRLSSFSKEEVTKMFVEGTRYLEEIARKVDDNYKVLAFRAGGWAVLPFGVMREGFEKAGIKVDSSIMHGSVIRTPNYILDFSNTPLKETYCFSDDVMKEDVKGGFVEAPISSLQFDSITFLLSLFWFKRHRDVLMHTTDGTHNRSCDPPMQQERTTRWQLMHRRRPFSLDGVASPFVINRMIKSDKRNLIVFISHPKDYLPVSSLTIIGMKGKGYKFCTYKDIIK